MPADIKIYKEDGTTLTFDEDLGKVGPGETSTPLRLIFKNDGDEAAKNVKLHVLDVGDMPLDDWTVGTYEGQEFRKDQPLKIANLEVGASGTVELVTTVPANAAESSSQVMAQFGVTFDLPAE